MTRSSAPVAKKKKPGDLPERWTPRRIVELVAWIVVLAALPFAAQRWWNHPGVLIGLAVFYTVVAMALRSRLIICTLIGLAFGAVFDFGGAVGSPEGKLWNKVGALCGGLIIGAAAGLAWDRGDIAIDHRERRNKSAAKRR